MQLSKENLHVLIDKTIHLLKQQTYEHLYANRGDKFDKQLWKALNQAVTILEIENVNVQLISGQRFPDIVLDCGNFKIGIEAKTTKTKKWITNGGSIFESTKVKNVENILIFFAKFHNNTVNFKYQWMEDCVSDVVFTHKPRFKINMELDVTFFQESGVTYQQMKEHPNPFALIKNHLKTRNGNAELWWVNESDEDDIEATGPQSLRLIRDLSPDERNKICAEMLIIFPEILSSEQKKYSRCALFLASKKGLIDPSLRDNFSTNKDKNRLSDTSISGLFRTNNKGSYTYELTPIPNYFRKILGSDYAKIIKLSVGQIPTDHLDEYWGNFDHKKPVLKQWLDKVCNIVHLNNGLSSEIFNKQSIDIRKNIIDEILLTYS